MKAELIERAKKLRERRAELVARRADEIAKLDDQIAFTQGLIDNWAVFTIDEALAALAKAGIRLRIDS